MDSTTKPPLWARAADLLVVLLLLVALVVAITGGVRERLWGVLISVRSVESLLLWAAALLAGRHVLVPRPSLFARAARSFRARPALVVVLIALGALGVAGAVSATRSGHERDNKRQVLFSELQPSRLANCTLQRFGEPHDGGYLLCGNLLDEVRAGYSYGINGYDGWGCDVSHLLGVVVHEYDCFNPKVPVCRNGSTRFHAECVADHWDRDDEGRLFDTVQRQITQNGDQGKRLVVKMDVEGAEWPSLLALPDATLQLIDQLVVEFHGVDDAKALPLVQRLKRFFYVVHVHHNNFSCTADLEPFPAWAYEVLFVNRRIARLDLPRTALAALSLSRPPSSPLAAPNAPKRPDCQAPIER